MVPMKKKTHQNRAAANCRLLTEKIKQNVMKVNLFTKNVCYFYDNNNGLVNKKIFVLRLG